MTQRNECPDCNGYDTTRVHTTWHSLEVIEVRVCHGCGAEYENRLCDLQQVVTHSPGGGE